MYRALHISISNPIAALNNCLHRPRRTRVDSLKGSHWRADARSTGWLSGKWTSRRGAPPTAEKSHEPLDDSREMEWPVSFALRTA
jgi:hypothetical protein